MGFGRQPAGPHAGSRDEEGDAQSASALLEPAPPPASWKGCAAGSLAAASVTLGVAVWVLGMVATSSSAARSGQQQQRPATPAQATGRQRDLIAALEGELELPPCLGEANDNQLLKGPLLASICSHFGQNKRVLIFGNGYDSPMWLDSNPRGVVRFLEDQQYWISIQPQNVQGASTLVKYTCSLETAVDDLRDEGMLKEFYDSELPRDVKDEQWDVILVDAPIGYDGPGRGQSIYAAHLLAKPSAFVYVNDCQREVEDMYVSEWFESRGWTRQIFDDNGNGGTTCLLFRNDASSTAAAATSLQPAPNSTSPSAEATATLNVATSLFSSGSPSTTTMSHASLPFVTTQSVSESSIFESSQSTTSSLPLETTNKPVSMVSLRASSTSSPALDEMGNVPQGHSGSVLATPKPEEQGGFTIFGMQFG